MYCITKYNYWRQDNFCEWAAVCVGGRGVWVGVVGGGGGGGVGVFVCTIRMFLTYPQYNSTDIPTSAHTHNI